MRGYLRLAVAVGVFCLGAHIARSSLVSPIPLRSAKVPPLSYFSETRLFAGKSEAGVVAIGAGKTHMGLYVYDSQGNCIGLDDIGTAGTRDDVAVVWTPAETGAYSYEIRNFGLVTNSFELAVR